MKSTLALQPVVDTRSLFAPERQVLLELLESLTPEQWQLPTVCEGWSVHDVALHLLWVDISNLSRRRDGYFGRPQDNPGDLDDLDTLIAFVNGLNDNWVRGSRRMSPQLVQTLLRATGAEWSRWVAAVDIEAIGEPVGWAGPEAAPVWLDIAREFTERWVHQQHIRDATRIPGATEPRFLRPTLSTFAMAMPFSLRDVQLPPGATARLQITGEAGGVWSSKRGPERWALTSDELENPTGMLELDQETAWRLFTRGIMSTEASATISGEPSIGLSLLSMVTILA